jgi:hypothetical protein
MIRTLLILTFAAFMVIDAIGQTKTSDSAPAAAEAKTLVLNYKFEGGGASISVLATSFDGACNVTVAQRSAAGSSKRTGPMDAATFNKLFDGASHIEAIIAGRITEHVPPGIDTETHHIITTLMKTKDGSKSEMYAVPEKDAPEAFRDWLKLLLNALPKA